MTIRKITPLADFDAAKDRAHQRLGRMSRSAQKKKDTEKFNEIRSKRKILNELILEYSELRSQDTSLFISLSTKLRRNMAKQLREIAEGEGFERVFTGFDNDMKGDLKKQIMFQILRSNAFIGVWSADNKTVDASVVPGGWMPLELGMALASDKPFRLIVHEKTHASFIAPVQEIVHGRFSNLTQLKEQFALGCRDLFEKVLDGAP